MDVNNIKPYTKNAKKHDKKQVQQIANSIKEFGFNQPIVLDKDNVVIVGHGRLEAAKLLGMTDVPVITVDLTEEQAKAYRLADNKLNESEWDMGLVIDELKGLSSEMLDLTGFDRDLIIEPDEKDDVVPENPPPRAKLGDIWQLGRHRLMCGDSTKLEDVEKLMDGAKADMVFTDPPYGVNMSRSLVSGKDNSIRNDDLDEDGLEKLLNNAIANAVIASKNNVPLYLWIGFRSYRIAENAVRKHFNINNCIVWKKPSIGLGGSGYRLQHELCIFSGQVDDKSQSDVWEFARDKSGIHPTIKPVELVTKAVVNSSKQGSIILDLFGGSGSTLIAAEKTNRTCYMMELDPKYCDVIIKRWEDYTNGKAEKISG